MIAEEKIEEALKPTNDYVFKRIFGHKGNEDITKGLINSIINKEVEIVDLSESPILEKDLKDDKIGILDIKAKLDNEIMCDIEMQVVKYDNIEERIMFYWSRVYTDGIHSGEDYNELNKTIVILLSDFELDVTKDIPKIHTKWEIREEEYTKVVLTKVLEIHIIELPKLENRLTNNKRDKEEKLKLWLKFILSPEKIGDEEMEENKDVKKAKEELDKIKQDKREKELARLRMKHIMDQKAIQRYGYKEGEKAGIQQGVQQERIKLARKLIKIQMPINQIIELTELTEEEIKKISQE
ncbi:MAG: Rpn family recombination-promoting nuclease/putative transposase [Clostridia bacterium]|nr:Rpn family recombination-promoting nuclease/putative transposase [Clostridia bacterium]